MLHQNLIGKKLRTVRGDKYEIAAAWLEDTFDGHILRPKLKVLIIRSDGEAFTQHIPDPSFYFEV